MNENEVEIQDKGLTASRLTPDLIDETITSEDYHVFDGSQLLEGYLLKQRLKSEK